MREREPLAGLLWRKKTCKGLVARAGRFANNAYLPLREGLAGAIGALQVDPAHVPDRTEPPNGVRHMRRVYEDDGGEGEAFYADTGEVG